MVGNTGDLQNDKQEVPGTKDVDISSPVITVPVAYLVRAFRAALVYRCCLERRVSTTMFPFMFDDDDDTLGLVTQTSSLHQTDSSPQQALVG